MENDFEKEMLIRKIGDVLRRMTVKELEALAYQLETQRLTADEEE